jgi:autotransporter-associated beta strand protein
MFFNSAHCPACLNPNLPTRKGVPARKTSTQRNVPGIRVSRARHSVAARAHPAVPGAVVFLVSKFGWMAIILALLVIPLSATAQNLVTNGNFTANAALFTTFPGYAGSGGNPAAIPNWTLMSGLNYGVNGTGTASTVFGPVNSGGNTYVFLQNAPIELAQTLPGLVPNTTYTVSLQAAGRYQATESNDLFQVQIGDTSTVYFTSGSVLATNAVFQAYSYTFTTPATFSGMPTIQLYNVSATGDHTLDFTAISVVVLRTTAATLTWTNLVAGNASGSWAAQTNWSGGTLPTLALDTANFNTLNLTANSTVTLDGNQTINKLNFSDANSTTAASWIINAGSPAGSTLMLGGASPAITVTGLGSGSAAVINAVIAGTSGFTFSGTSYLQLNGANTYSGTTVVSVSGTTIAFGNNQAFGTGTIQVGVTPGDGQMWFNPSGNITLTNALEIRTVRWIINNATINGVSAGSLTVNGNVLLNTGSSNVRDIYCNEPLTINGNISVTPSTNPLNKQGGYSLTLNGTNTVGGASAVNGGALIVNGPMNGNATFTVNSGATLGGTGVLSGPVTVASGGSLSPGNGGSGALTCGTLSSTAGATFNFSLGATNNPANGFIKVNGNVTLVGTLNLTDLGGFSSGVYTGLQYSGSANLSGLTNGVVPGSKTVVVTASGGYVLFNVLNGTLNPAPSQNVPMDLTAPLGLSWLQVPGATAYDVYLGAVSSSVANATTNNPLGTYQCRTSSLTLSLSSLLPNTTYYWRVDGVAANGTPTKGTVYSFTTGATMVDLMADTWVATDALGRSLPGLAECGSPRTNRPIGLFYYLWQSSYTFGSGTNWDVSAWIAGHPFSSPHNPWADNPIMQTVNATYWWGQPALDYYNPSDPWVLRRQIALINHAGVDVLIFDYSNGVYYDAQLTALCNMIEQMRFEGTKINLKIAFITHANSGTTATYLYNTLYSQGKYSDLWYYWQGKPLMLGYVNGSGGGDTVPSATVQNFFTWRTSWAYVPANQLQDGWQWIDVPTPQNWGYDTRSDLPEELPVADGGWANGNLGKSHSNNSQPDYDNLQLPLQHTSGLGVFFKEQMHYGLKYDPQFLFITQWNEWIAGSYAAPTYCYTALLADCCPVGGYYFVDEYNEEYSRDIEPMKGGHTDNYYFQMAAQNRLRKGVRPVPPAGAPQTINLAGGFAQWNSVTPTYYDAVGDTLWRNYPGASVSQMGTYTNNTGRNDLTQMKVARDANNFYFFAQCNSNLTSYTGSNWMVLFIDADQNHATGWEGYDYAVNLGGVSANTTTLYQNTTTSDAWAWAPVRSDIAYTVSGNQLMLTVPRAALGLTTDPVQFDFKWADNFQTNDIADFGVDGDTAPDRRFNYRYTTTTNLPVTLLADDFENGQQSVWGETWTNGSRWNLTTASPYTGNTCVVGSYATTGQSNLIARVSTAGYGSFRLNFHYKLTNVLNAQNLQISYLTTNGWVPIRQLSRDEYYSTNQSWSYNEQQNVWLNFTDTRNNSGPDACFFTTNFAFRIDASALTAAGQQVFVDAVNLTADTQMAAAVSPQAWQTQDIGHAGNTGYAATNGSTFTVSGSGLDIGNQGDAFRLYYQTRTGDGTLTARVASITPTDPWAKAGLMIRESLDSGARNACLALSSGNGAAFQQRITSLGPTTSTSGPAIAAPYWVRVVRSGTNFTGSVSPNGTAWTQVGTVNIAGFNATALWGLAVTAHNNTLMNVTTFDNLTVVQPPVIAAINNQTLIAGQTLTLTNFILNPGTPPRTLTWSLLSAPTGLTLDAASGILNWRPTIAQSPMVTSVSLMVADNGTPSLTATQSFQVTVTAPVVPALSATTISNGVFGMTISGDAGPDYNIYGSTNLMDWLLLQQNFSPALPLQFLDPAATNFSQRFYRVQLGP